MRMGSRIDKGSQDSALHLGTIAFIIMIAVLVYYTCFERPYLSLFSDICFYVIDLKLSVRVLGDLGGTASRI